MRLSFLPPDFQFDTSGINNLPHKDYLTLRIFSWSRSLEARGKQVCIEVDFFHLAKQRAVANW